MADVPLTAISLDVNFQIEIDDPKEISADFLHEEIHPKKNIAKQQFARPKGPAGRGPKRMTKTGGDDDD